MHTCVNGYTGCYCASGGACNRAHARLGRLTEHCGCLHASDIPPTAYAASTETVADRPDLVNAGRLADVLDILDVNMPGVSLSTALDIAKSITDLFRS